MSEATSTQALVDRILNGDAPLTVRAAAARGALPLPRAILVQLHLVLKDDADEHVRETAKKSLAEVGQQEIREMFSDPDCPPEVLAHFTPSAARQEDLAELLVFHKSVPEVALSTLAERGSAAVIELVLTNQERLLSSPGLLDHLMSNPALRPDQRGRILDILDRFIKDGKGAVRRDEDQATASPEDADGDAEEAAKLLDVDVGELFASSEIIGGEELEAAEDPEIRSAYRKILMLNTAQKAMLAMRGGHEERMILVRDSNKVVAVCVLRNPRMNDQEIESIAQMRNVNDEVLRGIGTNREWSKSYSVAKALVRNPKTPPGISTNIIPRLANHDLKLLTRDKNVPEMIRKMAKRTHDLRTQKQTRSLRKKR